MEKSTEKLSKVTAEVLTDGALLSLSESVIKKSIVIDNFFEYLSASGLYRLLLDDRVRCVLNKFIDKINPGCAREKDSAAVKMFGETIGLFLMIKAVAGVFANDRITDKMLIRLLLVYQSLKLGGGFLFESGGGGGCLTCPPEK